MAEDQTATYYQLKNSSVCLNVKKLPEYECVEWKFNKTIIADDRKINPKYKDRVVYSAGNLSLCINNLADTDAGIYEVSYRQNFITMSEKHQVIVQDVVPRPVIIMSKLSSNQSAGLTVICSIQDYWLWSVCDEDSCRTSQKSFSEVNITIFTENRAVVCRCNNHK
uniref:T-lymphocyte surface antigen Ly-9-like n=1 Tax=Maylandia zebra TaxID=106582 RepID=UPI000D3003E3|nr:T-lymphocyte surface antigen Ly-9-like [Maylandia zebra]